MKENQITKLFPEAPGPSIEDFFEVLKFNAVKKLTAILLAFSFLFTPLASAFAQTTTTIPSLESNNTTTPETELITPTPEPNPLPQEQLQPTEESGQIDQQLESEEPPPEMLLDSSDPDPRIETGYKPASPVHADESSGSLLTEYPIAVPPGRNGFQPDLKLQYNSQNSKEIDSQFGAGWGINIPYIERLNKSGLNNIYNNISTTSYFSSSLSGELVASTTASTTYVSRVDNGEFLNYVFSNNVWTATDKKGNRFYFGDPEASLPVELYSTSLYNDANLKQYFRLENTSATIGNNLTNNGSTPFNPGQFANGSDFGFSNSTRYLTNSRDPNSDSFLSGFSLNLWYKPPSSPTGSARWELGGAFSDTDKVNIRIDYFDDSGTPKVQFIYQKTGVSDTAVTYATTLPTSIFTMLTVTYNGSTLRGYMNGVDVGNVSASGGGSGTYGASGYVVGAAIHGGNKASGIVDDVAAFNRNLSGSEVLSLYPSGGSGQSVSPTLADPQNPSRIYKWLLDRVLDTNGNQIKYGYYKSGSQIYPSNIYYAGNTTSTPLYNIEFNRETRTDTSTSTKTGFQVVTNSRIKEINIKKDTSLHKKYSLSYTTGDNGYRSLLSGVTENGIDDNGSTTSLPSTLFTYQARQGGWSSNASFTPPSALNYAIASDINGDGFTDIMYAAKDQSASSTRVAWLNNGQSIFTATSTYQPPIDFYAYGGSCTDPWCDLGVRMADVNGDGLEDMLSASNAYGGAAYLNTGAGWTASSTWNPLLSFSDGTTNVGNQRFAEIGDINGDSLPDIFRMLEDGAFVYYHVYLNNGQGWTQSNSWTLPLVPKSGRINADLNGDTLTDFLRGYHDGSSSEKQAYINNSSSTWDSYSRYAPPLNLQTTWGDDGVRVFEYNGDGLPDINQSLRDGELTRRTYLNTGNGWSDDIGDGSYAQFSDNSVPHYTHSLIGDLDGNGLADSFYYFNDISGSNVNNIKPVDVLTRITYPTGGKTEISYKPSSQYYASTTQLNTLPLIVQTVSQITTSENGATSTAESFTYSGGKYYFNGPFDRRFAGFNQVDKTDAAGNVTKTFFHQGNTSATSTGEFSDNYFKIGKPYRVEQYNANSNLFKKTINKWDSATTTANGLAGFVKLAQTVEFTYDGDASHKDKAESYTYNNSKGNITQKIEYGEVTGSDDGTFSDSGTDDFTTTYTYATSSTTSAMSLLATESTVNNGSTKVKENKYYYDSLNLGLVNKGNLTKQEMWKASSTYVDIEKTYNAYGLVTSEKDPRDKTTTYTYDSFNLYPATVLNPLSQATQLTYDYSSGKIATTTDPNGNIFVNVYDGLDRVIEQKQPDPSATSTLLTAVTFTYTNATSSFSVKKSVYLDTSTSTDSYLYLDGLGRKKQERKEAEGSNYSVKDYVYNNIGSLQKESLPYFSSGLASTTATSTSALFINYTYDALYRVGTTTNANGTTTTAFQDWKTTVTDPNGKLKDLHSDAYGNLKQVDERNGASIHPTAYTYDYLGNLLTITDSASSTRSFTYDGLGRRLTAQDLHSPSDATYGTYTYTYDDAGNLTQKIDPKSQTINYTYDDINRQLTEDHTGTSGGTEVTYTYDSCTQGKGRLCTASSTTVNLTNTYNALGQLTQEVKIITGSSYTTSYTYDRAGNRLTITNPDSSQVKYIYNSAGLLDQVQRKESTDGSYTDVVSSYDYSPLEQPTVITFANGAITTNTYDVAHMYRLQQKVTRLPSEESMMFGEGESGQEESQMDAQESLGQVQEPAIVDEEATPELLPNNEDEKIKEEEELKQKETLGKAEVIVADPPPEYIASDTPENLIDQAPAAENNTATSTSSQEEEATPTSTQGSVLEEPVMPVPEVVEATTSPEIITPQPTNLTTPESQLTPQPEEVLPQEIQEEGVLSKIYRAFANGVSKAFGFLIAQFTPKTANAAAVELYETSLYTDPNIQEYFRLENTTASVGSNLTNNGSTPFNSAKFNNGADMGSSNSSKWLNNTNDPNGYSFLSGFTLNFWYKPPAAPTGGARWELGGAFSDTDKVNMRIDYYDDSGTPKLLYIYQKNSVSDNQVSYSTTVPTSYFSMLTLSYNGSSTKAYINGTYLGTISVSGGGSGTYGVSGAVVGAAIHGGNKADGIVDDFSIFNRALTDEEISDLYTGDWPVPPSPGPAIQDLTYTYDNNGNITQIRESASTTLERVVTYSYDDLNRLTNASTTAASTTPYNYSYTYSSVGNILTRVENGTTTTYTYATGTAAYLNPHAVATTTVATSTSFTYDNNGNLTSTAIGTSTQASYTWDYNNRLTQALGNNATSTYSYDPWGQRVKMTVATTSSATTYYPTKEYNITGSVPTKHIFLPDGTMIATIVGTGTSTTVSYIHTDHLGGPNVSTSDSGEVVQLVDTYPYGTFRLDEQNGFNEQRKGISGHEYDPTSSLTYMNSRYFNGANAKFISQDPAFLAMGDSRQLREMTNQQLKEYLSNPQNLNTYSYALNNPIVNTDPTGNAATLAMPFAKIGAGILSGISATALGIGAAIGVLVFPRTANAPAITDAEREAMTPQPFIGPIMPADQSNDKIETPRGLAPDGVAPPVENPGELKVGPASRPSEGKEGGKSYWDSKGGEWRYFPGDERHNPHWDYNPHKPGQPPGPDGKQGNEWRNVPIGNDSPLKNNPSSNTPKK